MFHIWYLFNKHCSIWIRHFDLGSAKLCVLSTSDFGGIGSFVLRQTCHFYLSADEFHSKSLKQLWVLCDKSRRAGVCVRLLRQLYAWCYLAFNCTLPALTKVFSKRVFGKLIPQNKFDIVKFSFRLSHFPIVGGEKGLLGKRFSVTKSGIINFSDDNWIIRCWFTFVSCHFTRKYDERHARGLGGSKSVQRKENLRENIADQKASSVMISPVTNEAENSRNPKPIARTRRCASHSCHFA